MTQSSPRAKRWLAYFLRFNAAMLLCALLAVPMPYEWMQSIDRALGLGELPHSPIIGYLTRSLSALYGICGLFTLVISLDVDRYRPLVHLWGWSAIGFGAILLAIDLAVGMPFGWTLVDGSAGFVLGGIVLWLARRAAAEPGDETG